MIDASVIVSYVNSRRTLPKLLACLEAQDYPRDRFEVILINGDDYKPRASEARGHQIGVKKAKGPIIFFTNSDRYPPANWISYHMKHYPEWDLVGGTVVHHVTKDLTALNFANISMKREVLDGIPINDIPSQHDADFAFRFVKQSRFKGIIDAPIVSEDEEGRWSWEHQFLMARNHMILRRKYHVWPPTNDVVYRVRHPMVVLGSLAGLVAGSAWNLEWATKFVQTLVRDPYVQGSLAGLFTNKISDAHGT